MQSIASLADRLDMSAEEAVEKLRFMLFEVSGVDSTISDEEIDILIDVDDDSSLADKIRLDKLAVIEKAEKAAEKKAVAAAKKKATAAKKKASAAKKKKAAAKKKPAAKKKTAVVAEVAAEVVPAEILPDVVVEKSKAEILPPKEKVVEPSPAKVDKPEGPKIVIGSAIEHEEHTAEIVRADGTHLDVAEVQIEAEPLLEEEEQTPEELGLLAKAEKLEIEANERRTKQTPTKPDPKVVEEVIRKATLKQEQAARKKSRNKGKIAAEDFEGSSDSPAAVTRKSAPGSRKTGKTARKRIKKMERKRRDEDMRRSAAAALKEYSAGTLGGVPKKRKKKKTGSGEEGEVLIEEKLEINVDESMTVEELAEAMEIDATDIILELMDQNIMATKNQNLSMDLIRQIAEPQGYAVNSVIPEEESVMAEESDDPDKLLPRAPVITVMGHVDHGKTSLLDQVRKASVAEGEAGGITQHIAAYEVSLSQGRVVFLDTPGHEAFTAMRARGAQITDVVVLVVAADDGLMPQTIEAINHAKAAEVPIVVAVNKCDKPDAQPDRIRQELIKYELTDEAWGGKTIIKDISALNGDGIDELMELLVLETDLLELKANPDKKARGTVIESEITRGQGPVAWVLVNSGTLRVGDIFLCGETYGRVRAMQDTHGQSVTEAGPSTPVVVLGFNSTASAGDHFIIVKEERIARSLAEKRQHRSKMKSGPAVQHVTLEDFHSLLLAGEQSELNVVIKGDVQGSVDVLQSTLPDLGNEEVKINIVHKGVGNINESDILLASASNAIVLGFHVQPTVKAKGLAQTEGVDIHTYEIIYEMMDDVRKSLEGMLTPDKKEVVLGHAEIRQVFKSSSLGNIAGCMQLDGESRRDALARVQRNGDVIWEGKVDTLRRDKDQVTAVQTGFECGIKLVGFDDIEKSDIIEMYIIEEVAKTLA